MIFGRSLHICARGTPKFADRLKHAHADGTHRPVSHCFTADTDTPTAAANSACVQCFACLPRLIISLTSNRYTPSHRSIIITFILYIPRLECFSSPIARQRVTGFRPSLSAAPTQTKIPLRTDKSWSQKTSQLFPLLRFYTS